MAAGVTIAVRAMVPCASAFGVAAGAVGAQVSAAAFPAVVELSALNGSDGFVLSGEAALDYAGLSVSGAGDFNGDGYDDVLVGALKADTSPLRLAEGKAYVVFGGPHVGASGTVALSSLDGINGVVLEGKDRRDYCGASVSDAGDFNADGFADVLIGAPGAVTTALVTGESYLVFGGPGVGGDGRFDLATLNGSNGFALLGVDAYDYSGTSVSAADDVNGDGIDDVIIGAERADPNGQMSAGESYVLFGGAGVGAQGGYPLSALVGINGFRVDGIDPADYSGGTVSGAGDVNGDGFADLLVGAVWADPGGVDRAGETYVVFGGPGVGSGGVLSLAALDGTNGFLIPGVDPVDLSGQSVSGAGDINGDGLDDLIVGADNADGEHEDIGESYVVFGASDLGSGGTIAPASLNGGNGFLIRGSDLGFGERAGWAVSGAGDVNAAGFDDVLVGAIGGDSIEIGVGKVYVLFGGPNVGASGLIDLAGIDGTNGFAVLGIAEDDNAGWAVSAAGDVNGDGVDDIVVGAPHADPDGNDTAGEAYVVFGRGLDSDADGLFDRDDNCTRAANPDQRDSDGDGYGNPCDPDLNGDLVVNFLDLGLLKAVFLTSDPHADFDGSGTVDFADLGTLKSYFFQPPSPSGFAR